MKEAVFAVMLAGVSSIALADSVGGCGLGSKVFDGQKGVAPQVLAVTTNGTLGNQTFGISSGTLGCSQDGTVKSNWKTALFIDSNKQRLARDMSVGSGETLDSLAHLMGVREEHLAQFNRTAQSNLARIFPSEDVPTEQIMLSLKEALSSESQLAQYAQAI